MIGRALVLVVVAVAGVAALFVYRALRGRGPGPETLSVEDLGLELMSGCCAFVVFTNPACRPCKSALSVVRGAAEQRADATEVATVDAVENSDLAVRYGVRTIPTTFLITASGHVVQRWRDVPDPAEVETALAAV